MAVAVAGWAWPDGRGGGHGRVAVSVARRSRPTGCMAGRPWPWFRTHQSHPVIASVIASMVVAAKVEKEEQDGVTAQTG